MKMTGAEKRKQKRWMNYARRTCGFGKIVEACNYHPSIVTRLYYDGNRVWSGDIDVKSLIDGRESACSLLHCGIVPLTKEEANERVAYAEKHGINAMIDYYCGPMAGVEGP